MCPSPFSPFLLSSLEVGDPNGFVPSARELEPLPSAIMFYLKLEAHLGAFEVLAYDPAWIYFQEAPTRLQGKLVNPKPNTV